MLVKKKRVCICIKNENVVEKERVVCVLGSVKKRECVCACVCRDCVYACVTKRECVCLKERACVCVSEQQSVCEKRVYACVCVWAKRVCGKI